MVIRIEYVCLGNIVRSQTYEAVTNHHNCAQGKGIEATSSGLGISRWSKKEFTDEEVKLVLHQTLRLEHVLPPAKHYQNLMSLVKLGLPQAYAGMNDAVLELAVLSRQAFEAFNFRQMLQALSTQGIDHVGYPKPTTYQKNIDLVVCTSESMIGDAATIYPRDKIIAVNQFGPEPVGFSPDLEDHIKNVRLAQEQVPQIIQYAMTKNRGSNI